jgi:hypothetical protein
VAESLTLGANTGGIALSPDGKTVVYFISSQKGLWVRPLDGTTSRLIPGTERRPSVLVPRQQIHCLLYSHPAQTRGPRRRDAADDLRRGQRPRRRLVERRPDLFGTLVAGLVQGSASGGTPSVLTTLDAARGEIAHRWPQVLPGGASCIGPKAGSPKTRHLCCPPHHAGRAGSAVDQR